jgi:hypothetical protein
MKNFQVSKTLFLFFLFCLLAYAKGGNKKSSPSNVLGIPSWTHININNISSWFQNNGSSDFNPLNYPGLVYPKGSDRTASYQSGLIWSAKLDGTLEVGGSSHLQGTVPGRILTDGTAANPNANDVRIYRVRRDYKDPNADFSAEINDDERPASIIYSNYDSDWKSWPAAQGAPYEDVNGNGKYDPAIDIPGVKGSDQTIWFVCNDLDPVTVNEMYGSIPIGIEEQVTIWAYRSTGALGNMFFRKYTIINKNINQKPFTEMYISMWSDVDIGDASDDFIGCDTTLSMMYFYNGKNQDIVYDPLPPPAIGFDFLQGPKVISSASDRAIFNGNTLTVIRIYL